MDMHKGHHAAHAHNTKHVGAHTLRERGADFVLVEDIHPPPRIELARERMLLCRLYLGLIRSINEDYGPSFAGQNGKIGRVLPVLPRFPADLASHQGFSGRPRPAWPCLERE